MAKQKRQGFSSSQWMILLTLMIASFLGRLDGTIVNLAIPTIIKDFGITVTQASWISTAYIIANAIFVPIFGKLGDLIGRKPLYLFGIIGFTLSSMLAGLSFNFPSLIVFRILQAITVSIDYPIALSIIAFNFTQPGQRATAMGMWSGIFAAAQVFGPLLGGPLIDNFTWRSVFYVNLPLGILGTFLAFRFIEEPVKVIKGIKHFDVLGSVLLGIALGVGVLVLDQGQTWGWGSTQSIFSYIVTAISLIWFIWVELHTKEPVVNLEFFMNRTFTASIITSFISFMGMIGGIFLIPLFVQNYIGYSVTQTGYLFIPMAFAILIAAQLGARLSQKFEARFLTAAGMTWSAFMLFQFTFIDIKWTAWDIIWHLAAFAFGIGIGLAPLTQAATSSIPIEEVGVASSVLALARNISGAFGVAIFATILSNGVNSSLLNLQKFSVVHTQDPSLLQKINLLVYTKANVLAFANVFHIAMYFMLLGGISALFVRSKKGNFAPQSSGSHHTDM